MFIKLFILSVSFCKLFHYVFTAGESYDDLIGQGIFQNRYTNQAISYRNDTNGVRKQRKIPDYYPFPCKDVITNGFGKSTKRPSSVHQLRPGDIDVIAAMGDSLVAGNGALEEYALGTLIEYRGVSWCVGGDGTWREYLTLPNILKEFNPSIKGYSTGKGEFFAPSSNLNVAIPVSTDADAVKQAEVLVNRMKKDRSIDFKNDWKIVTVFFGANDLCSWQCYNKESTTPIQHGNKLQKALDYLQNNMPRTFVNLVPVLDVSLSLRVKRSIMCHLLHRAFCSCFHRRGNVDEMAVITQLTRDYQHVEQSLVSSGRYNRKEDFTVVIQPFIKMFNAPRDKSLQDEVIDISYVTHDCFHFSQKGHALAANLLWNNMLEPVGAKSEKPINFILQKFLCPSTKSPFLFTYNNSLRN